MTFMLKLLVVVQVALAQQINKNNLQINKQMNNYLDLMQNILRNGYHKAPARKGLPGTIELFGQTLDFDLREGFPIITTKAISFNIVKYELLWFINGDTSIKYLLENGVHIWDKLAYDYEKQVDPAIKDLSLTEYTEGVLAGKYTGQCGPVYGHTWRNFGGETDQLANLLKSLVTSPNSRRHILTAWDPTENERDHFQVACPCFTEFCLEPSDDEPDVLNLSQMLVIRSSDVFLGLPYDIAEYALLQYLLVSHLCSKGMRVLVGKLKVVIGSAHIYDNYIGQVNEQLVRMTKKLPVLHLGKFKPLIVASRRSKNKGDCNWVANEIELIGYSHEKKIKATINIGEQ